MKRVLLVIALFIGAIQFSNAQISYGVKAGMNFDVNGQASEYITMPDGFSIESNNSNGGYHAGVWLRVKVPLVGLYVRPEIIYTDLKSEYTLNVPSTSIPGLPESSKIEYSLSKVDVPVLLGLKILGVGNVFLGPNLQYLLKSDFKSDFSNDDTIDEEISIGLVIGAGIEFWKLGLDVRFETGFASPDSVDLSSIGDEISDLEPILDVLSGQKPNQIIVGLSYKF